MNEPKEIKVVVVDRIKVEQEREYGCCGVILFPIIWLIIIGIVIGFFF